MFFALVSPYPDIFDFSLNLDDIFHELYLFLHQMECVTFTLGFSTFSARDLFLTEIVIFEIIQFFTSNIGDHDRYEPEPYYDD